MNTDRTPLQNRLGRVRTTLRASWAREDLDRRLADGADADDPLLRVRAERLTKPRTRAALAAGLESAVTSAYEPRPAMTSRVPVRRPPVRGAHHELMRLAGELRHMPDPHPQGVAMAELLLTDFRSPLYTASSSDAVATAACDAASRRRGPRPAAVRHSIASREHHFCVPTVAPIPPRAPVDSADW
jgi:hypothetical protein